MPIEIRELVIRAVVEQPRQPAWGGGELDDEQRAKLVQKCVDEIMRKLRRERER